MCTKLLARNRQFVLTTGVEDVSHPRPHCTLGDGTHYAMWDFGDKLSQAVEG